MVKVADIAERACERDYVQRADASLNPRSVPTNIYWSLTPVESKGSCRSRRRQRVRLAGGRRTLSSRSRRHSPPATSASNGARIRLGHPELDVVRDRIAHRLSLDFQPGCLSLYSDESQLTMLRGSHRCSLRTTRLRQTWSCLIFKYFVLY